MKYRQLLIALTIIVTTLSLTACLMPEPIKLAEPHQIISPEPIEDNSGEFMNPYTEDGVLTEWVDKGVNAAIGAQAGQLAGAVAGQQLMEQIPLIGGLLGAEVGERVGREIALKSVGGMEFVKDTSDSSFTTAGDLALYLYANHSDHKHYKEALEATMNIYPALRKVYHPTLMNAPTR